MSFTTVTHLPLLSDIRRRLLDRTVVANMAEILEHHQVELLIEGGSATATFRHRCSPRTARIAVVADCSSGRGHWKLVSAVAREKSRFYSYVLGRFFYLETSREGRLPEGPSQELAFFSAGKRYSESPSTTGTI